MGIDYGGMKEFVLDKLTGIHWKIYYHSRFHTMDVLNATEILAPREGVGGEDLILLRTAALCHDTGYLHAYDNHELLGTYFVQDTLPQFGYQENPILNR